ncbi:hypothetical protein LINPERHAP1_LOCUS8313 [Linum perenne]
MKIIGFHIMCLWAKDEITFKQCVEKAVVQVFEGTSKIDNKFTTLGRKFY